MNNIPSQIIEIIKKIKNKSFIQNESDNDFIDALTQLTEEHIIKDKEPVMKEDENNTREYEPVMEQETNTKEATNTKEQETNTKEEDSVIKEEVTNTKEEDSVIKEEVTNTKEEDSVTREEVTNTKEEETNTKEEDSVTKEKEINIQTKEDQKISSIVINTFNDSLNLKEKPKKIKTLCFSGGGVKGFAFIGALEKLLEKNIFCLSDIKCYVGTSIGSILSFLLNLGWNIHEIKDFTLNFNFNKLTSEINSISFFQKFGIQDGDRLQLLFVKFLESKLNVKDITFEELYNKTNKKLLIIGTNLTKSEEVVFSYKNTPKFSVILALRISVSVPIIFTPVEYENEFYVDGGIVNNFPLNHCSKRSTFGFYIKNSYDNQITSIKNLMISVLGIVADTISQKNVKKYRKNIIEITNTEYSYTKFDIDLEMKLKIIKMGYDASIKFLNNY